MKDELAPKIKQIADMLNQETLPEGLKDIISLLTDDREKGINNEEISKETTKETTEDMEMFETMKNIMGVLGSRSKADPRVNLLNALKPFLNNNRQKKIGNCIMFLRVSSSDTMKNLENND